MVVVVVGEASEGDLGVLKAGEALAVEDLGLEDVPEGFDLAVGPGRVDLGPEVLDMQLSEPLAEAGQDARHPAHKWHAVVAHQLERLAAELKALVEPAEDGRGQRLGMDPKADDETG